ncbi:MAG TPA: TetR/AcrR family transcriptional regulator [Solirubrobacter sp.]|nr:TetR/AcrR family transcriptional regulator [Solirubrobacter sp.]
MAAAAELIAELGWGRVTTRAVAERAGLPHGSVSYHFRGKQELLAEAALHAFQQAIPQDRFERFTTVEDLLGLITAEVGDVETIDPVLSRLMLEAMREAERDPALRERMGAMMGQYRTLMVETVRADQKRGAVVAGVPPEAIATLIAAFGDGLLLHVLLDPELDTRGAIDALRALLTPR